MSEINYKFENFEGPLDLLLHLISKHKLDINDIEIVSLVDQYVAYVRKFKEHDMYVASEFLEMAARLVYMKTVSLLPKSEEAEELKKELTGELVEYKLLKETSEKLSKMATGFDLFTRKASDPIIDKTYTVKHNLSELMSAYISAAGRKFRNLPPKLDTFKSLVSVKIVSVSSRFSGIISGFKKIGNKKKFSELFSDACDKYEVVAVFLAVLELCKNKNLFVDGIGENASVELLNDEVNMEIAEDWE